MPRQLTFHYCRGPCMFEVDIIDGHYIWSELRSLLFFLVLKLFVKG